MTQLDELKHKFHNVGVDIVAVSVDGETKVSAHVNDMGLSLPVAYDLPIEQMHALGICICHPRSLEETD